MSAQSNELQLLSFLSSKTQKLKDTIFFPDGCKTGLLKEEAIHKGFILHTLPNHPRNEKELHRNKTGLLHRT